MKINEWKANNPDAGAVREINEKLGISKLSARLLAARGVDNAASAEKFLKHDLSSLHDPFLLPDMRAAVDRINSAIENKECIVVYGDYDVDGITATYILYDYLKSRGALCSYYIPDRITEGYGLNEDAVDRLIEEREADLIITVDTGVTAHYEIMRCRCEFIVTDHHECPETLPLACAVINPHRADSKYPFADLAGVGVAYKLICALERRVVKKYLPYVCIGTIADVMPLADENRAIVYNGLEMISETQDSALLALIEKAGLKDKKITASTIGFSIAPRLNAAGRMDSAERVVKLFTETSLTRALDEAEKLCELNRARQAEERRIFDEALKMLADFDPERDCAIVLCGDSWHHGVIGIVASRLSAKFDVPTVLLARDGEFAKGSGRSVAGFNLYEALYQMRDILDKCGGHEMAAGLTISYDKIDLMREKLNEKVRTDRKTDIECVDVLADLVIEPEELNVCDIEELSELGPFGETNPEPLLIMRDLRIKRLIPISNGRHLKLVFSKRGCDIPGIIFGKTAQELGISEGDCVDALFNPGIDDFREKSVQLYLCDVRACEREISELRLDYGIYSHIAAKSASAREYESANPTYNELGCIWRAISRMAPRVSVIKMAQMINLPYQKLFVALDVFCEIGLLKYREDGLFLNLEVLPHEGKADLESSEILKEIALKSVGDDYEYRSIL